MTERPSKRLLITDLDNTLWDWFEAWYQSFSAMLERLAELSGIAQSDLEQAIRPIHRSRGTAEYSNLLNEIPALISAAAPLDPSQVFDDANHVLNSQRKAATNLYPGVKETIGLLRSAGIKIVAYTESLAYWTEWRILHTGLDGMIDVLYSAPDHDFPSGMTVSSLRTLPPESYGLKFTRHRHVPRGINKPNVDVLQSILSAQGCLASEAVYIGDSLMKDIAMAQAADILDVHAKYGEVQNKAEYELLRRVSHWSDDEVERERRLITATGEVVATITCQSSFAEILPTFDL
jgi:FMN phosphatase YigB (HAD superfamily)